MAKGDGWLLMMSAKADGGGGPVVVMVAMEVANGVV